MNSAELYDLFRSDVTDIREPYLWEDAEVWSYMDAAYRQFTRLTGGIPDFTSDATRVELVAGENTSLLDPSIQRVMSAYRSDGSELKIVNLTDTETMQRNDDFGALRPLLMDTSPGEVLYMIIGAERGKAKWVHVPVVDDIVNLYIYRTPLVRIVDDTHPLDEVDADHHIYLLDWMKHLAYKKQDAETIDLNRSEASEKAFKRYCAQCKAEWERYKHKTRVVSYGGL